jgi:hypothetical protein
MWKKMKHIKIPGSIKAGILSGAILGITTALFISLPVTRQAEDTSVESISTKNESLELEIRMSEGEELRLRVTGAITMEVVQNLVKMLKDMDTLLL